MDHRRGPEGLAGSWEWMRFAAQLPANPIPIVSQSASGLLVSGRLIVTGAQLYNVGAGSGGVNLRDGQDVSGTLLSLTSLAAGAASPVTFPGQGVLCEIGLFAEITTATIHGAVFIIPLWHYDFTPPGT